jgi:carbon-monoxide dehydrogenase medium subunit
VQLRSGGKETDLVVDVKHLSELNQITYDPAGGLTFGAAVPCSQVHGNQAIRQVYPALAKVASLIGGTQIQNRASLGGNLCNAAPSADSIPILIALQATCRIVGPSGAREIEIENFCTAPGQTVLQVGELLVSFHVPARQAHFAARYLRFTPRNEMDIAVAGAGVGVVLENGTFRSARIALGAVAPTPLFVREAGDWLAGKPVNAESVNAAAEIARRAAKPITDLRGTAEFRRHLCAVLTRRALEAAVQEVKEARI